MSLILDNPLSISSSGKQYQTQTTVEYENKVIRTFYNIAIALGLILALGSNYSTSQKKKVKIA
jgi:hypothetical protein